MILCCLPCIVTHAQTCSLVQAQRELEAQQAALESLWRKKADAEVALACDCMQEEQSAQMSARVAYLGALHAGRLRSMQDAHLLQLHQLHSELAETRERHAQQLELVHQESALREFRKVQEHAAALQQAAEEHEHALSHATASAEERVQLRLAEVAAIALLPCLSVTSGKIITTEDLFLFLCG